MSPDFYATCAQVIPVLLLAIAFEVRFSMFFAPPWWDRLARSIERATSMTGADLERLDAELTEADEHAEDLQKHVEAFSQRSRVHPPAAYQYRSLRLRAKRHERSRRETREGLADVLAMHRQLRVEGATHERRYKLWNRASRWGLGLVISLALVGEVLSVLCLAFDLSGDVYRASVIAAVIALVVVLGAGLVWPLAFPAWRHGPPGLADAS